MTKHFLWVLFISLVLSGCQTASNVQNENSQADLETDSDAVEADVQQTGFIDTVPPVSPDDGDATAEDNATDNAVSSAPQPPKDLWVRMRQGFKLNLDINKPRLSSQLRWYSSHLNYLDRVSVRGQRYLYYIVSELEKAGIPSEIALLPIVESGFDPFGYSHGRASGPWQFIPSTGQM
ncbi:MAG: lytic transglycosylase, partial [Marinomonas sp.]